MTGPDRAVDSVTVVVKGHFNPAIFSPAWMLREELIGPGDYDDAELQIISPDLSIFQVGPIALQVARDSLQVATTEPADFERARDVTVGIVKALHHTPIGVLGINRAIHFEVSSIEEWHNVGNALTPKDVWRDVLTNPGMRSLTLWDVREDERAGYVQLQIEPSVSVHPGIFAVQNDHYELSSKQEGSPAGVIEEPMMERPLAEGDLSTSKSKYAVEVLDACWQNSMERAEKFFARVSSLRNR